MTFSPENFVYFALGIVITLLIARRFAARKELYYHVFSYPVFSQQSLSDVAGFEIKFNGAKVEEVWRHVIFVWNGGNQPIWENDLSATNPLRLEFGEDAELSIEEVVGKSENFSGQLVPKKNRILLQFPHMDSGDGISFVVLEALRNEKTLVARPKLEGHVVGLTAAPKEMEPLSPADAIGQIKFTGGCATIIVVISVVLGLWLLGPEGLWPPNRYWLIPIGVLAVIGLGSDFFGVGKYYRAKTLRIPESFDRRARYMMQLPYVRRRQMMMIERGLVATDGEVIAR